jgi:hypothetical protein
VAAVAAVGQAGRGLLFGVFAPFVFICNILWSLVSIVAVFATAFDWGIRDAALLVALSIFAICSVLFLVTGVTRGVEGYQLALELCADEQPLPRGAAEKCQTQP